MEIKREQLGKYCVFTATGEYAFSVDSLLLARFSVVKERERVADICAGNGVVGYAAAEAETPQVLDFYELNPTACDLLKMAGKENRVHGAVYQGDVIESSKARACKYDCVLCNPPYYKAKKTPLPQGEAEQKKYYRDAAKTECAVTLEEVVLSANRLLAGGGRFCVCVRVERLSELCALLESKKMPVKRLQLVCAASGDAPYLALVESKKGAKSGVTALPVLTIGENL